MATEADVTLQNADAAAEALAKSQSNSFRPEVDPAREAELDKAFEAATKGTSPADQQDPPEFGRENGGVRPPIEGAPTPEQEAAVKAAAEKAASEKAAVEKAESDRKAAEEAAKTADPDSTRSLLDDLVEEKPKADDTKDPYGDVKLRSDASPKTRETFEQLKTVAKQREEAARQEAEAAKQSVSELQNKVAELEKRVVPDEVQNELKELRQFRAQFDTEHDPEFRQKYDSRLETNYSAIYAKLQSHGLPAAEVEKLKAFGREERDTAIDAFLAKLPPISKKFIEAKLLDNVNVADERDRALQEARSKADEILAKQKQAPVQQTAQRDAQVASLLKPALPRLPWLHVREIPANTGPEEKKQIEAHNTFAAQMQESLKAAIVDDSPQMRAEAAIAVPLARYYKREYAAAQARAEALQKQLDDIKQASATARTARSNASTAAAPRAPETPPADPSDAIDKLFAEATGAAR